MICGVGGVGIVLFTTELIGILFQLALHANATPTGSVGRPSEDLVPSYSNAESIATTESDEAASKRESNLDSEPNFYSSQQSIFQVTISKLPTN